MYDHYRLGRSKQNVACQSPKAAKYFSRKSSGKPILGQCKIARKTRT